MFPFGWISLHVFNIATTFVTRFLRTMPRDVCQCSAVSESVAHYRVAYRSRLNKHRLLLLLDRSFCNRSFVCRNIYVGQQLVGEILEDNAFPTGRVSVINNRIDYFQTTGIPLKVSAKLQLNMLLEPSKTVS